MPGLLALVVEKFAAGATLFFLPDLGLLFLLDEPPRSNLDARVWLRSKVVGIGFGRRLRSWPTQDFL